MRLAIIVVFVGLLGVAAGWGVSQAETSVTTTTIVSTRTLTSAASFVPACPKPFYTVDGNLAPLFCKIDNPAALKFYALESHLFALTGDATPAQVSAAIKLDAAGATTPEMCNGYALWSYEWNWHEAALNPAGLYC